MISGKVKENVEISKKVGLFAGNVICINPTAQEYKDILGIELAENSKATEYLGESKDGNTTLRINVWLENAKKDFKSPVTFFLENKQKENKTQEGDGKVKKYQYINNIGTTSWGEDRESLPKWFKDREHRVAFVGEEELYNFTRTWLGKLDYRDADTVLQFDWKQLMKGNVKALKDQIGGVYSTPVVAMATVKTVEKEDGLKEYQSIWNKMFLPEYSLKQIRLHNYSDASVQAQIKAKILKEQKMHEKFVIAVTGEYGIKDFYKLRDLSDYDSAENIASTAKVGVDENGDELPF